MRFVIAIVLFVLAFLGLGLGVAQRTIWAGPASVTAEVTTSGTVPLTVIPGGVLNAHAGTQGISVEGEGAVLLAVGRTADVMAWVGEASYNEVEYDAETGELSVSTERGSEATTPNPVGSDLWVQEYSGADQLTRKINAPTDVSVLIASDGTAPAPSNVSITWPLDNSTPWSGPLILGGVVALLGGLAAFVWALAHARTRRGPRRAQPRQPKNPKPPRLKQGKGSTSAPKELETASTRRGRRRNFTAATAILGSLLLLAGCSSTGGVPAPLPTSSPDVESPPTAVTEEQLAQIIGEVSDTLAAADEARDATLAATRLAGPALALRTANYTIRGNNAEAVAAPPAIPTDVKVSLPQQTDIWPRTVFAVVDDDDATTVPVALVLIQEDPRSAYKVNYAMALVQTTPDLAPADIGAPQLPRENKLGLLPPDAIAAAYGDVLLTGAESEFADLFDTEGDPVLAAYGSEYKAAQVTKIPGSAKLEFANGPGEGEVVSFGTNDSGQIVALVIDDVETVTPVEAGAAVNPNGAVKALVGESQTTKGVRATYGIQLLFYVPQVGDEDGKITLLAYSQGLVSAVELG